MVIVIAIVFCVLVVMVVVVGICGCSCSWVVIGHRSRWSSWVVIAVCHFCVFVVVRAVIFMKISHVTPCDNGITFVLSHEITCISHVDMISCDKKTQNFHLSHGILLDSPPICEENFTESGGT